jgi:hypothetical protein
MQQAPFPLGKGAKHAEGDGGKGPTHPEKWQCAAVHFRESILLLQLVHNGKYNSLDVIHHVVIPKVDHFVALRLKVFRSFFIILFLFQMLTAIQFDDEFCFG